METLEQTPARVESILERSVCLLLSCGYQGNSRALDTRGLQMTKDGQELDTAKDEMSANWRLFSNKDLAPCNHAIEATKQHLRALTVDGGTRIFGAGAYLLPLLAVSRAEQVLADGQALLSEKVEALTARLPELLEARRAKLGPVFRASAYPTADEVRAAYRISWTYVRFGAPDQLAEVDAAAYARAVADQDARLRTAYDDVVTGLRQGAVLVLRELARKLSPGRDGKAKALQPTALRDLNDLLEKLPILNSVGEDAELADTLARVGVLAEGVDVPTLRRAPALRGMLVQQAQEAADRIEQLIVGGERAMTFGRVG